MSGIKRIKIDEKEYTALGIGSSYEIPLSIMQKERENCLLVTDEGISQVPWYGITKDGIETYILLPPLVLDDVFSLTTINRGKAPDLIRKTARGIKNAPHEFTDFFSGFMPLYRIYIVDGRDILLLPPDAGSILTLSRSNEEMDKGLRFLLSADKEEDYRIVEEMVQLIYFAITSRFPYERSEVRLSNFKPYPVSLYDEVPSSLSAFIENHLMMKEKEQRKLFAGKSVEENMNYFLDKTSSLPWPFTSRTNADRIYALKSAEESTLFAVEEKKKEKKAGKLNFIRKKGIIVLLILLAAGIVSYFVGHYLYETFKPPLTKDMTCTEIIEYTIEKQNELDAAHVSDGFKKAAAQEDEVRNLYILNKTRQAYEGREPLVKIEDYLESGAESLPKDSIPYGVMIETIVEKGENTYSAELTWYSPYAFSDEDEEENPLKDGFIRVFKYTVYEDFVFSYSSRGWLECVSSLFHSAVLTDVLYIAES